MPDPVLVPPTPTINQSDSPEQIAHTTANVQAIFDKVAPKIRGTPTPEAPLPPTEPIKPPSKPVEPPSKAADSVQTPVEAPTTEPKPPTEPPDKVTEHKVPSFIEKALEVKPETPQTPAATVEEDFPEEPVFKTKEESKAAWKNLRDAYKRVKTEATTLKSQPVGIDEPTKQELEFLKTQNKELQTVLSRTEVESHREFQQKIIRPMNAAWGEASRIVKETGRDPQDLAKALALSGAAQYEALDELFTGMPESAKIRVNNAVAAMQNFDSQRKAWLSDAPRRAEELKKSDLQRQYAEVNQQKAEMKRLWDEAGRKLREEAKVEVMLKSDDPDASWWNEQADRIEKTSEDLFLNNTDMEKVAFAMRLAPMVDPYRKLWLTTRAELVKAQQIIKDKFGSEPNLSESGGNTRNGIPTTEEDLSKPFDQVFLREYHKQREQGAR